MASNDDELPAGCGGGAPIRPPRLEDAGLEDCALPPESIAEAFSLAAEAVSSRLARFPLSDSDSEEDEAILLEGGCVDDGDPSRSVFPDVLVGGSTGGGGAADAVMVVVGGDKVVTGGRGEEKEEDRVVVVGEGRGEGELRKDGGCVADGIAEPTRARADGDDDEEEVVEVGAAEKAILVPDFA